MYSYSPIPSSSSFYSLHTSHSTALTVGLEVTLHFLEDKYVHKLFGILPHGRFISFPPSIYLFSHSCIPIWTHGYYLYTLGYHPIYFILLYKLFSVGSYVPLTYSCHLGVFVWFPELSFFIPCPRSQMSHFCKFLLLENSFRNQGLVLGVLTAFRLSHLRARKYMCVYNSMWDTYL